jgi:hypothetical protein
LGYFEIYVFLLLKKGLFGHVRRFKMGILSNYKKAWGEGWKFFQVLGLSVVGQP